MFIREDFEADKRKNAQAQSCDKVLAEVARDFIIRSDRYGYGYQWTWLGLPVVQMPQDIVLTQEIIWQCKPDVIIETGIAWGGSVVLYASILQLIGKGKVIGVDLNLLDHVTAQIMAYPFSNRIHLYKGSSTDADVVAQVKSHIEPGQSVMVLLDSNHTHDHVLQELKLYAPLITKGQFLVVSDTVVDDIPPQDHRPRPWGQGNNPKTALRAFLNGRNDFDVNSYINGKLLLSYSPGGYCRRVADTDK